MTYRGEDDLELAVAEAVGGEEDGVGGGGGEAVAAEEGGAGGGHGGVGFRGRRRRGPAAATNGCASESSIGGFPPDRAGDRPGPLRDLHFFPLILFLKSFRCPKEFAFCIFLSSL